MIKRCQPEEEHAKRMKSLQFMAFPRFSISPMRNCSVFAASEAFKRATLTLVVILFSSCLVHFNWSCKEQIKDNSPADGARLSTAAEELQAILYETGQALDPVRVPCKRGD
jgi:hypothetical protein